MTLSFWPRVIGNLGSSHSPTLKPIPGTFKPLKPHISICSEFFLGVCVCVCVCVCARARARVLFRATPTAYGGSQARGWIGAAAASLCHSHSHSNGRSQSSNYYTFKSKFLNYFLVCFVGLAHDMLKFLARDRTHANVTRARAVTRPDP